MWKIKVDDGFCEWGFKLKHSKEEGYSIKDIVDIICNNTDFVVVSKEQSKAYGVMEMVENCLEDTV